MTELIPMELTEDEQRMILERRAEEEHIAKTYEFHTKVLMVASDYLKYLNQEGYGTSFSTFVNSFGYDLKDSSMVYQAVLKIFDVVNTFEVPKEKTHDSN
ncbi:MULTISPECIES: hypothetical protein [unclassified Acinetobacter]|uniref:hypothetical protein n=1 Tax=unclassified Acinetobacter TaxID=196816 RepID=UPI001909BE28|nr:MULTISPECIES: hypothetical protein [unclassified Acinetobacter]MBK0062406.1 hypothetical protein [Acinetobacter sp. S55]MBK0066210.1 hypothetical protein [Acinetobacter sp. S54]